MKLMWLTCSNNDFDATVIDESYPNNEMEYQIVAVADNMFSDHYKSFYYENGYPAVDLIKDARIQNRLVYSQ